MSPKPRTTLATAHPVTLPAPSSHDERGSLPRAKPLVRSELSTGGVAAPERLALPEVLTVDELAALLRVERKTVYAAIARGEIPGARRIGARLRISRDAVLRWLADGHAAHASRCAR
jgi:excisionase family DNA binding protein